METASGPICEVTYVIDREIVEAFDAWLAQHIEETLHNAGVGGAEVYQQEDDEQGHARRIAHYFFSATPIWSNTFLARPKISLGRRSNNSRAGSRRPDVSCVTPASLTVSFSRSKCA